MGAFGWLGYIGPMFRCSFLSEMNSLHATISSFTDSKLLRESVLCTPGKSEAAAPNSAALGLYVGAERFSRSSLSHGGL